MASLDHHYGFRDDLIARVERDLLGPVGAEDEILDEEPATSYITGVLYPSRGLAVVAEQVIAETDVDLSRADLEDTPDTGVSMANRKAQSAMGLTFAVDVSLTPTIHLDLKVARYEAITADGTPTAAKRKELRASDEEDIVRWRRRQLSFGPIPVATLGVGPTVHDFAEAPGLELRIRVRDVEHKTATITASLVNVGDPNPAELVDSWCYFQPEIAVSTPDGSEAIIDRSRLWASSDPEVIQSRLLHRHAPNFAAGHGCAAEWLWQPHEPRARPDIAPAATSKVWTSFVPRAEVLLSDSNPEVAQQSMLALGNGADADILASLSRMVEQYRDWISARNGDAASFDGTEFADVAAEQLAACGKAARRMEGGISRLRTDPTALRAFRLMNRAMATQRARTAWIRTGRAGSPDEAAALWRPFQIGFLLLCIDGIADREHEDRRIADVLWFPTGGGKTEAYLGLIAFTTFLRRMRAEERGQGSTGGGVTVLMRYTLRLLTLQQFERASTLVCAMERLRQDDPAGLGCEPISIGMWVGRAATPNTITEAEESLAQLRKNKPLHEKNPVQLQACPWCGTAMDHSNYEIDAATATVALRCHDAACTFQAGLPVHVIDEDIYAVRPTLVIATADKFAQIAWRENVAHLFNRAGAPDGTPPPELVIQDELHLISGPLGSLSGLYECAIDIAANGPKVIASTATIRRAGDQGLRLFDREVRQFPPAGLDARDSWFAVEAHGNIKASRLYLGLLAPGTSQASLLIRAYAALLHGASIAKGDDDVRDAYWTLIGYFNSLRLLSAAELQVHADVVERLHQLAVRDGSTERRVDHQRELTSRVDSSEIPRQLAELFVALPDEGTVDVVLATNMISVGVDVDRLGLMAIMGQPQTTAEYIQASSRVGRRHPGLVVAMLNAARSRDRSHYEGFRPYHSALYRQVEATSVTPFAARARDRALHAVLVGLVRLMHPPARANSSAADFAKFEGVIRRYAAAIVERVARVAPAEQELVADELEAFVDEWGAMADAGSLLYEAPRKRPGRPREPGSALLRSFEGDDDLSGAWETMWSLRDVDVESDLYLER